MRGYVEVGMVLERSDRAHVVEMWMRQHRKPSSSTLRPIERILLSTNGSNQRNPLSTRKSAPGVSMR